MPQGEGAATGGECLLEHGAAQTRAALGAGAAVLFLLPRAIWTLGKAFEGRGK